MKKTTKLSATVSGLLLAGSVLACSINGKGGFVPDNNLYIPSGVKSINGISEKEFNEAIDSVEVLYAPIIAQHGAKLEIERNWDDGTVNAYAMQEGKTWKVAMFGGLARHATITKDAMALVVCHELGHHLGGAPKKGASGGGWWGGDSSPSWASNEGQADYFATLKCLRKTWINDNNTQIASRLKAPQAVVDQCKKVHQSDKVDSALCVRMAMAGKSVADLFAALGAGKNPNFSTPDTKVVSQTDDNHPASQCRLDTYYQGSLCDKNMNEDVSDTDENTGTCTMANGYKVGVRPLCWFKPSK